MRQKTKTCFVSFGSFTCNETFLTFEHSEQSKDRGRGQNETLDGDLSSQTFLDPCTEGGGTRGKAVHSEDLSI